MGQMLAQDLAYMSIFRNLSSEQLTQILPLMESCDYPKDATIFEQGAPAENLYLVVEGEVVVRYKAYDGPLITVAHVCRGGIFGWSAALGRSTYTSSAVCLEKCHFFRISSCSLRQMCDNYPETGVLFLERLASAIAERETNKYSQVITMLSQKSEMGLDCSGKGRQNGSG